MPNVTEALADLIDAASDAYAADGDALVLLDRAIAAGRVALADATKADLPDMGHGGELLEAVRVGLTVEQEIRDKALFHAVAFVDQAADWADAADGTAVVLDVAERFAAWIEHGPTQPVTFAQDQSEGGDRG